MGRTTRGEWATRVRRWKQSGLKAREFAAREGLKLNTLYWWSSLLGQELGAGGSGGAPGFVEVVEPRRVPSESLRQTSPIVLVVRGEMQVLVPNGFEAETLRRVLSVVEGS